MVDALRHIEYKENEALSKHCTFRVGGNADLLILPKDKEELLAAISYCKTSDIKYMIIGNGSNLLFDDKGYRGAIIKISSNMSEVRINGEYVYAEAGALLSKIARKVAAASLAGMEFAAGIPGTLGGAVCMNAGAYGGEMKDIIETVDVLTPQGDVKTYSAQEMDFSYRHSLLSDKPEMIVLGAVLKLATGNIEDIESKMKELADARISKQPLEYPSAGSTFKRPEGYFAGKLIQDSGLRGYRVGGACVSEKHCGFVINYDHATSADIKQLIADVQDKVYEQFGVRLETEVKII